MDDHRLMYYFGNEPYTRFVIFLVFFSLMALWQKSSRFRPLSVPLKERWLSHLGLAFVNLLLFRLLFSGTALWAAYWAARHGLGLFRKVEVPFLFSLIFTVVFLDWMVYYLHRMFHALPVLWRVHRIHHTDPDVEVSTGVRFHPFEVILTMLWKAFFIVLLGAPLSGVFVYEVMVMAANLFNHSNARLPKLLESWVRLLFVTPDMHRVHHSLDPRETNSNFGFIFSFWDRALMTYRVAPEKGQEGVLLGQENLRAPQDQTIANLLKQPFLNPEGQFKWSNLWGKPWVH